MTCETAVGNFYELTDSSHIMQICNNNKIQKQIIYLYVDSYDSSTHRFSCIFYDASGKQLVSEWQLITKNSLFGRNICLLEANSMSLVSKPLNFSLVIHKEFYSSLKELILNGKKNEDE